MGRNPAPIITTFPQASLRSRTVGFPESGSDLGSTPRSPSQEERSLSADSHTPQLVPVYFQGRSSCSPALCPATPGATKCPEPLRAFEALPLPPWPLRPRQRALPRRPRYYRPMRQSCSLPPPTVTALVSRSLPVAVSPGWAAGPSQRYLHESFPRCLDPYPGGPCGAQARFFPQGIGLPHFLTGSALHVTPHNDVSAGIVFEAAAIHSCSGLRVCSPPRSFPPQRSQRVRPGTVAVGFGG